MVKNVLMVAYHFPPIRVSSGLQRSLAFSKYLPENGWKPIVLTAHPRAYEKISDDQLKDIPENVPVVRAFALDTSRHLSIAGRYLTFTALPDRWVTWWIGGVWSGMRFIRKFRPKVIWTTYPIATAHLIGLTLHKLTGLPWIADFRDSMTEDHYPSNKLVRKVYLWIEKKTVYSCSRAVFTTHGAIRMYRNRYPDIQKDKWVVIPNGYNEEIFSEIEKSLSVSKKTDGIQQKTPLTLIHSGIIYPSERNPNHLFKAISSLKKEKLIDREKLKVILRATGHDHHYKTILEQLNIADIVHLEPGVSYREALVEMFKADGLLLLQGKNCNHQIPAKLYEYLRARRPILALTDLNGDTASTLIEAGCNYIAPLDKEEKIRSVLLKYLSALETKEFLSLSDNIIVRYSRKCQTKNLADLLDEI
ncbi:MAG: glycosyltransferase [Sedimenticola sp.]